MKGMTYQEWLLSHPRQIEGSADGEDDGDGDDDAGDTDADGSDGDDGGDDGEADAGGRDDSDDDDDDEHVRIPAAELKRLRNESARAKRERMQAERAAKTERERQASEQGRWEDLAKEREVEVSEATAKAEAAEYQLDQYQRAIRTSSIASRLNFQDPNDAIRFLNEDQTDNDDTVERSLRKLAEQKPYLLKERKPSGGPMNGQGGSGGGLTREQVEKMSPAEVNANWEAVQAVLQNSG